VALSSQRGFNGAGERVPERADDIRGLTPAHDGRDEADRSNRRENVEKSISHDIPPA
jgi:hypothetical protein